MKLFLLAFLILFLPFQLDARSQATSRITASARILAEAIIANDDFDRAPSTSLGANWTEIENVAGTIQIETQDFLWMGDDAPNNERYGLATWDLLNVNTIPDGIAIEMVFQSMVSNVATIEPRGIALRIDPACILTDCSFYGFEVGSGSTVGLNALRIIKMVNGNIETGSLVFSLGSLNDISPLVAGDILRFEVQGITLTGKLNGQTMIGPVTDPGTGGDPFTAGLIGLHSINRIGALDTVISTHTFQSWTVNRLRSTASNRVAASC